MDVRWMCDGCAMGIEAQALLRQPDDDECPSA